MWVSIRGLSVGSLIRDLCGGLTVGGVPFPPYCTTGRRRAQGTCSFLSPAAPWASCLWPFSGGACGDRVHLSVPPRGPGSSQTQGLCSRSPCPELPRTRALSVLVSSPPPRPPRSWPHCHCWVPSPQVLAALSLLGPLPPGPGCTVTAGSPPPRSWPHCHCWPPTASPERSCARAGLCPLPLHRVPGPPAGS